MALFSADEGSQLLGLLLDATINNPSSTLYIKGSEFVDGSIRFLFTEGDPTAHIESRTNGVWNDTGLRLSSSTLELGRDMSLSAIAGFLETRNASAVVGHQRSFIPHIEFDETRTLEVHAPILDKPTIHVAFSGAVSEITGTTIGVLLGVSPGRAVDQSIHEVGSVGATQPVTVSFYVGTDNTGVLFNRKVLPASDLVANTTLTIEYGEDLGFEIGVSKFQEFTSAANFSLKTDAGGNPLTSHVGHEIREIGLIGDNLMLDENLGVMFDLNLNPVYSIQFP